MVNVKLPKHLGLIRYYIGAKILHSNLTYETRTRIVSFRGRKLKLLVADTFRKKSVGLMNFKQLGEDEGMLFVFNRSGRQRGFRREGRGSGDRDGHHGRSFGGDKRRFHRNSLDFRPSR